MTSSGKVLASAARSASYNMVLQVMFRMITFLLNAFILRYISKEMIGVVNVRLTLLYSTVLFVAREAFRRACLSVDSKGQWTQTINLIWCTIPLGFFCSTVLGFIWMFVLERPDDALLPHYDTGVLVFGLSAFLELLVEPLWVLGQAMLFVRLKVIIEGAAIAGRCIMTVILVHKFPDLGIIVFCIAQLVFTFIYVSFYYIFFIRYIILRKDEDFPLKSIRDIFPRSIPGQYWADIYSSRLVWSFFKQGFLKQILTEGERYVMTIFDVLNFGDQGIYDIINNLGSLAARFIFLPIEESGYLFFAQTIRRGEVAKKQPEESIDLASKALEALLKCVVLIGITILVFGYAYSFLLLDLYAGTLLSSGTGPLLLRCYCMYVLLIAINGTTECFVFAAMGKQEVDSYNRKMLVFSIAFLTSSYFLTKSIGSVGFILANCLNMLARIIHSLYFINNFYKGSSYSPLSGLVPKLPVLLVYLFAGVTTIFSEVTFCCDRGIYFRLIHIFIGGLCLLAVLVTIFLTEKKLISFILDQWNEKRKDKQDKKDL
ncbi:protein RFT1 homolog [Anneissia japonica]|uniref:protein RFT1 homolog n=1 Tax=Anneissia japonica TaxID=1529436 RepID=UPI0014256DF6|nr:protein RFT1 homolog [Anneissia japonica]